MRINSAHVIFEGSEPIKVLRRSKDSLGDRRAIAKCVLLVEDWKQNILSVSQMVYGGKE